MKDLYFVIGTEAEIMKMFIVIQKAKKAGFNCKVISTGQNIIRDSVFMKLCDCKIDVDLSIFAPSKRTGKEYIKWIFKTLRYGIKTMKQIKKNNDSIVMIVHGDTLTTLLGSIIARRSHIPYCHVEAGLRSYNWFNPFPEEIDRYFSSKRAELIFCPTEKNAQTARKYFKGEVISTHYNTNIETLQYALEENKRNPIARVYDGKYFVVALHRQENLLNETFMTKAVDAIVNLSKKIHCVFILHEQTAYTLDKFHLRHQIEDNENITTLDRLPYLQFIDAVCNSEFLIADGAGNQQEMYYLGKPYLIMRNDIEKDSEGIQRNCIGYAEDFDMVANFYDNYEKYQFPQVTPDKFPSDIIVAKLLEKYGQ